MMISFGMEKTWQFFLARGAPCSHTPTSEELLFLREALALPVTDLPPVVSGDPLHRQLQVLLLLG